MLDLEELVFRVNTKELESAVKALDNLATAVNDLNKPIDANVAKTAKAAKAQSEAATAAAKAAKAKLELAAAENKSAGAAEKSERATKSSTDALQRQQDVLNFMTQGFSKGQASTLAYAKASGLAADALGELGKVLERQRTLMGTDPFDKSIGAMKALKNETTVLREVNRLYNQGLELTKKQMEDLAREKLRVIEAGKIEGKTFSEIRAEVYAVSQAIKRLATEDNKLSAQMKASQKEASDRTKALAYLEDQLEKTGRAVAETNNQLNRSASNSLVNFERALKKSGLTAEEQAAKLAIFKKNLQELNAAGGNRQVDYLSRALGPQITDIAVGLATGQSPLMVLLQQGGQLRDQFALAGVAGKDMGKMLTTAAVSMISSVKDVAMAVGGLFVNAIGGASKAIVGFADKVARQSSTLEYMRYQMALMMGQSEKLSAIFNGSARVALASFSVVVGMVVAALLTLPFAITAVIKEQNALSKALATTGGTLGLTTDQAIAYAGSMQAVGATTSQAMEVISEMSKTGQLSASSIGMITKSAVEMEKYAGVAIKDTVKKFSELAKDPLEAIGKLAQETGKVSPEVIKMVGELERQGRKSEAAGLAMREFAAINSATTQQIKDDYGIWMNAISALDTAFTQFWGKVKDVVRGGAPKIDLKAQLAEAERILAGYENVSAFSKLMNPNGKSSWQAEVDRLKETLALQTKSKDAADQRLRQSKAEVEVQKIKNDNLSKEEKQQAAIKKIVDSMQTAGYSQLEIEKEVAKYRENNASKTKDPIESFYDAALKQTRALINDSVAAQDKLTKAQELWLNLSQDPRFTSLSASQKARLKLLIDEAHAQEENTNRMVLRDKALAQLLANEGKAAKFSKDYYKQLALMDEALLVGAITQEEFNAQLEALNAIQPHVIKRQQEHNKAIEEYVKKVAEQDRANFDLWDSTVKLNRALDEETASLGMEVKLLGASEEERKRLIGSLKIEAQYRQEIEDIKKSSASEADRADAEVAAEERRRQRLLNLNTEIAFDIASKLQAGITDSVVTALFEGGKAGKKKLRDLLVAELRKPITLVINAMVNTVLGRALNSMGVSIPGISDASSMAGISSGSGSLAGSWNNFASSSTGGKLGLSNFDDIQGYMPTEFSSAVGEFAGMVDKYGGYVGSFAAALEGDYGKAIGSAIGQYFGGPIGAWIGGELGSMLGLTDDSGTLHTGAGTSYSKAGGLSKINPLGTEYGAGTQAITDQVAQGVVGILDSVATSFGNEAGYSAATAFADDTSKDGAWGSLVISKLGGSVLDWASTQTSRWAPKEFADGEAGAKEYMQAVATSVRDVLIEEVPAWADAMLTGLGDSVTMEALATTVAQIGQIQSSFEALGISTDNIDVSKLSALFGSVDNFIAATNNFYDKFGTNSQKLARTTSQLQQTFADLGMEIPKSKAAYYDLVTSLDLTTEAGREAYQALLASGDAFLYVQDAATQAALSMQDAWARVLESRNGNAAQFSAQAQIDNAWSAFEATGNRFGIGAPDWFKTITYDDFQNYTEQEQQLISQILDGYAKLNKAVETTTDTVGSTTDAASARKDALNAVYSALEKSVNAQISVVQKQYDLAKAVYEVAISAVRELRGQVTTTATMQANEGQTFIADALAKAKADGSLPDSKKLSEAIGAVRASIDSTAYTTKMEQDKAKILLSNDLQALADIAGPQMTTAELQLVELQGILTTAKEQLNVLIGVNDSILSVADALNAWQAAMQGGGVTSGGSTGSGSGTSSAGTTTGGSGGFVTGGGGGVYETRTIEQQIADLEAAGIPYHVSNLMGQIVVSRASSFENQHRIPGYANGGAFTNGIVSKPTAFNTAVMGEAGSEAIMPLANIGGSLGVRAMHDPELRDAVLALNSNIEGLRAEVRADVSHNAKTARLLDRVIPDGQSINVTGNIDGGTV